MSSGTQPPSIDSRLAAQARVDAVLAHLRPAAAAAGRMGCGPSSSSSSSSASSLPRSATPHATSARELAPVLDSGRFLVRLLNEKDYDRGFIELLSQLTTTAPVSRDQFLERLQLHRELSPVFQTLVVEDTETAHVVATASIVFEYKFVHSCGVAGHVEDVVVNSNYRGKRLGALIVDRLVALARDNSCYKVILDCDDSNVEFYTRLGFKRKENQMAKYLS